MIRLPVGGGVGIYSPGRVGRCFGPGGRAAGGENPGAPPVGVWFFPAA